MKRTGLLRLHGCIGWVFALLASAAAAQTPAPLPTPDIPLGVGGDISAIARQPDGGLILGGSFATIDGVPRRNLARLQPDGTLDPEWNPDCNGRVAAVAVDASGDVYVGGQFDVIDGRPRRVLAKLSGKNGVVDAVWNPGASLGVDTDISALAVNGQGDVFAASLFHIGTPDRRLAKFSGSGNGAMDESWAPALEGSVQALVADRNGSIFVSEASSDAACCLYQLSDSGSGATRWRAALGEAPWALALGPDGSLYAAAFGAGFASADGGTRKLVRFAQGSSEIDRSWNPPISRGIVSLATDVSGAVYAALYEDPNHDGNLVKVLREDDGGARIAWQIPSRVRALAVAVDGSLYLGRENRVRGSGWPQRTLARVDTSDGASLPSVDATEPGTAFAVAFQSNGGTIVAGAFSKAGAVLRSGILRLAPDGQLDPDWNPVLDRLDIRALAIDEHDDVYVGGYVLPNSPDASAPLVKLSGSGAGAVDTQWRPAFGPNDNVGSLAADGRGALYVGASLYSSEAPMASSVSKLSLADATMDWSTPMESSVRSFVVGEDGIYVAGGADAIRGSLTKLSESSATLWSVRLPGSVSALAQARNGSLYVGGIFDHPQTGQYVLKFSRNGVPDARWNSVAATPASSVWTAALAIDAADNVLVAGWNPGTTSAFARRLFGVNGALDTTWGASTEPLIQVMAIGADGALRIGGTFVSVNGHARGGLAALPLPSATPVAPTHGRRPLPPILIPRSSRPLAALVPPRSTRER